jgi:hydrophobic/amphiphilic exporter-1 (mainly G- bacteria), HAE1 family
MFVDFFIKRPIFASVCAIVFVIAGAICIPTMPVAQYPNIAPPRVGVTSSYTGANATTVESGVTTLLEQQINGAEGVKYITSNSGNDGVSTINITFNLSRDIDLAAVDVQTPVSAIQGRLPDEVKRTGVSITKSNSDFVMAIGFGSENHVYSPAFLSNYADVYVRDALKRVKGVGDAQIFGERKYSMRIWLDPDRLARRGLTAQDVVQAVAEQNAQVPAGEIGQQPVRNDQTFQMSVRAIGRLSSPRDFENIVVRASGSNLVRLKDVGRVELGAEDYSSLVRFRGQDAVGIGIFKRAGANAIDISSGVTAEMKRLQRRFPPGLHWETAFDTTLAVRESIREVLFTLAQAILLVVIVIFVFLQQWKSVIIPAITIPVSLIGTFMFMKIFGFSINTLTLFGLTLATGLVVDDAIVVIENISRFVQDKGMEPHRAAWAAMKEVTGPVIAISLVLAAVFIPVAFFPGSTGLLYRQFALTIAFSVAISTFNALTLTPALSALWLSNQQTELAFFRYFNRFLDAVRAGFCSLLTLVLRWRAVALVLFALSLVCTYWLYKALPSSFVPNEDSGYFLTVVQAPEGVSLNYTIDVLKKIEKEFAKMPEIESGFGVAGFGFNGNGSNTAIVFASMKPWHERLGMQHSLDSVINRLRAPLARITEARVVPLNPPPIEGLSNFGGFDFQLEELGGMDIQDFAKITRDFCRQANQLKEIAPFSVYSAFNASTPQLVVEVDRDKAKSLNVNVGDVFSTLQTYLGSAYVNDFDMNNRVYRVYVQADEQYRSNPKDIDRFYVRSAGGQMVSLSSLVKVTRTVAPQTIFHYNLFRSAGINGSAAQGVSSGQAMSAMEKLAQRILPAGMSYEWSSVSLEELEAGGSAMVLFVLGLIFVFLVLAAQYESFTDPFIILFSVPLAMLGALLAQYLAHLENDVFCQIGLLMLIGLACKNAILIVEFANHLQDEGLPPMQAVIRAAEIRLRPILMTSLAFIFGILPLVFAQGAGAASRHSLGTAVCGGMVVSTIFSLFVVPVIYVTVSFIRPRRKKTRPVEVPSELPYVGDLSSVEKV